MGSMTAQEIEQNKEHQPAAIAILLLLTAATALRLYRLNEGLWLDEIFTLLDYARLPFASILTTFESENQHILYSLLARLSILAFGETAWALRLPAVLFGVGSIWVVYLLGLQVASRREALLSAALLTFSYHHVWFSQNARGYTGLLFWSLLSSLFFARGLAHGKRLDWLLFAISAALGMYTHLTMGFVIVGQFLTYLMAMLLFRSRVSHSQAGRQPLQGFLYGFVLSGLFTALLYAPVVPQILSTVGGSEVSVVEAWKNPLWTVLEIVRGLQVGFAGRIMGLGALVVFGAGVISYARTYPHMLGLLFLPPLIGALITIGIGHHLWPRFFFFAMGFGALVVVRGVMVFGDVITLGIKRLSPTAGWLAPQRLGTLLAVGMILVSAVSVPFAFGPKQDYEGALGFVEANRLQGDAVVTVSLTAPIYQRFFGQDWPEVQSLEELNAIRSQAKRTWVVYTFEPVLSSVHGDIMESIQSDFTLMQRFSGTVGEGDVFVYLNGSNPTEITTNQSLP